MIVAQARPVDYDKAVATAKGKAPDRPVVRLSKYGVHKVWDNYKVIADVQTDDSHFVRIASGTIDGWRYVTLRMFYFCKNDEIYKPGNEGFKIPMFSPSYENDGAPTIREVGKPFLENFITAVEIARTMQLADKENALYILRNYTKSTTIKAKEISNNENQQP